MSKPTKLKLIPFLLYSILFADVAYLAKKYYDFYYGGGMLNTVGCAEGCDEVMLSNYALLFKIPIPFWGLAFYVLCFLVYLLQKRFSALSRIYLFLLSLGCVAALTFIYIMYFDIEATCKYCLVAHLSFFALTADYLLSD